jgi:hypothetical protein
MNRPSYEVKEVLNLVVLIPEPLAPKGSCQNTFPSSTYCLFPDHSLLLLGIDFPIPCIPKALAGLASLP